MDVFEIQTYSGKRVGEKLWTDLDAAKAYASKVAKRWSKNANKRGSGFKIVKWGLYNETVAHFAA